MKNLRENFADWYARKIIDYIFKLNDKELLELYYGICCELKERADKLTCLK